MTVSRKTLTLAETFFQEEVKLEIDVKRSNLVTILDILNANKVSINQTCGGSGTCGTCRIEIINSSNFLMQPSAYEMTAAIDLELLPDQRLSCQCEIDFSSRETNLVIKILSEPII